MPSVPFAGISPGVSAQTQALAFRELAAVLHAGITLDMALDQVSAIGPLHFTKALQYLANHVRAGKPLSEGLVNYRSIFNPVVRATVLAGEQTGTLDQSFAVLASYFEQEAALIRTVRSAMLYPSMVVFTAILAVFILSFTPLMDSTWAVRLLWVVAGCFGLWALLRFRLFQQIARHVAMLIPFFGGIIQQLAVARFCYSFGSMIRAGVPYLEGLEATQPAIQHPAVGKAAQMVYFGVRNGTTIEECIASQPAFPPIVRNLVGAGEASGTLDEALLKAAEFLQQDAQYKIKNSAAAGGVVLFLLVAAIIGIVIITFWSNYFNLIMSFAE